MVSTGPLKIQARRLREPIAEGIPGGLAGFPVQGIDRSAASRPRGFLPEVCVVHLPRVAHLVAKSRLHWISSIPARLFSEPLKEQRAKVSYHNADPRTLVVVAAFDPADTCWERLGTKLLVSSLLKSEFSGEIIVTSNFEHPLYMVERARLRERFISCRFHDHGGLLFDEKERDRQRQQANCNIAREITSSKDYDWIVFVRPSVIALKGFEHLLNSDSQVLQYPYGVKADTSIFAVRANILGNIVAHWETMPSGNSGTETGNSIFGRPLPPEIRSRPFERGSITAIFDSSCNLEHTFESTFVELSGCNELTRYRFAFAIYMTKAYGDSNGLYLDIIDA
jgi:hypothetical protein